jgi:hypothetical protein
MLTLDCFSKERPVSVFISILFAEEVLSIFEDEYPKDLRPRKAIEAAKHWLKVGRKEVKDVAAAAVAAAAYHSYEIAHAAFTAAAAAFSGASGASGASNAAYSAYYVVDPTASYSAIAAHLAATKATHAAADAATYVTGISKDFYIHSILLKHLDEIIQFHLDEKLSLRDPDQVFQWLSEEKKKDFLYNLDILLREHHVNY